MLSEGDLETEWLRDTCAAFYAPVLPVTLKAPPKKAADDSFKFCRFFKITSKARYFMRIVCWLTILM